jgi:hypothetical protein
MTAVGVPVGLANLRLGSPVRTRIRYGIDMARWLRIRRGRRARMVVGVVTVIGSHQSVISRITLYGAVLHGGRRLKRREIIALRLPSGWRVKGRVRWRLGARCGITFCSPVADFARILSEGAAVKSPGKRKRARTSPIQFPMPSHVELVAEAGPGPCPGLVDRLARLVEGAKGCANRVRSWTAGGRDRREPRLD